MTWIHKLHRTYDQCAGWIESDTNPLMPIDHVEQQTHIEITLGGSGDFRSAVVVPKETVFIPATEASAGRTSAPAPHGLSDKLQYIASERHVAAIPVPRLAGRRRANQDNKRREKGSDTPYNLYVAQLRRWVASKPNPHVEAVLRYVEGGTVIGDLLQHDVLHADREGNLLTQWHLRGDLPALFKILPDSGRVRNQSSAVVRWIVELGTPDGAAQLWLNRSVQDSWQGFMKIQAKKETLCMVTGTWLPLAANQPRRLRHGADSAKLISANDTSGYTFRGRFELPEQAYGIGSSSTQKAHNALRWLISRQGHQNGDQVIVTWAVNGQRVPTVMAATDELRRVDEENDAQFSPPPEGKREVDAAVLDVSDRVGQLLAKQVNKLLSGYKAKLQDHDEILVLAIDSATPGRLAVTYYRELRASDFLERIQTWHQRMAWPQTLSQARKFTGAPAPRDIAEAAYGRGLNDALKKFTVERLLPCILDGRPIPRDLVLACAQQAANPSGKDHWDWERCLGVACALVRGYGKEENYSMSLQEDRTSRDYLFGRLLAIAEKIERSALYLDKETRTTTAERLMQRFSDHPALTWRTIELALRPYMQRLQNRRPAALYVWKQLLDDVISQFQEDDFTRLGRLAPEFLLGYHCQRSALRRQVLTAGNKKAVQEIPRKKGRPHPVLNKEKIQ